jgi:hypothetical protein
VIGLVAPYGAGCTSLADMLTRTFSDFPACLVTPIHVAKLIEADYSVATGKTLEPPESMRPPDRRKTLQAAGTNLRKEDPEIVGRSIVYEVFRLGKSLEETGMLDDKKVLIFLVDSLKNINDVKVLRRTYGQEFYLVSVHAPHEERWGRMKKYKSWTDAERVAFEELDKIDSDEKSLRPEVKDAGQQVSRVAAGADYHIVNTQNLQ